MLETVQEYSDKLSDVQTAGQRTFDVLFFLDIMQYNVKEIAPELRGKVEVRPRPLESRPSPAAEPT